MKKRSGGTLVPEVPTMDAITKNLGHGRFAIQHFSPFGPLEAGFIPVEGREQAHRSWRVGNRVVGEMNSWTEFVVTEMEDRLVPEFHKGQIIADLARPISEMITTTQGAMDLMEKVRLDIDVGLADVPLLYQPLYDRLNGPFPGGSVQIGGDVLFDANVIFQQKFEAGEIVFGTLSRSGAPTFVPINTYAAGFEWDQDILEFDRSYEVSMNARAFGRAYNYLLNHLHLSPIIAFSYAGGNSTAADATAGEGITAHTLRTFQTAYRKGATAVPQRIPTTILANEADRFQIEDALLTPVLDSNGNKLRGVPVSTIIYYNGATVANGVVSATYPGVTAGTCYFIAPKFRMKELVHHDMRIDTGPGDISRLIAGQQVAVTRRGQYLDIPNSVEKITLPTS